ncbi:MAG: hypothetical protein EOP41_08055 [Sphingobacteriaceae bacterium]|nr:MAG: hypothetical protein EOP41_08055 [Sphingobacteriaceae bacterium]
MAALPAEGSKAIIAFRLVFTKRTFILMETLLRGALLATGARTICTVLRFCGLGSEKAFHKYHRFLSRAKWSGLKASYILLNLLIENFCKPDEPLVFGIDETIERRRGTKIKAKGIYRDPVRSSHSHFVKCSGLRWMCLMLLTTIPWADRVWALPFLTALAPSERYCKENRKKHKKVTDWARQMLCLISRWLPGRKIIIVADSSYSALELLSATKDKATIITRLRLDAALYKQTPDRTPGQVGRRRLKGERLPTLKQQLSGSKLFWQQLVIPQWYGQKNKCMKITTGTALWYHSGMKPVFIRWVLLKDPQGKGGPAALLSTDVCLNEQAIVNYFIKRWTVEVTFKEVRTHLGVETQRQWSDNAIARTTPLLMGLFSITTLWANELKKQQKLVTETTAWYQKKQPTFSDALAAVRRQLWARHPFCTSAQNNQTSKIDNRWLNFLIESLTRAA